MSKAIVRCRCGHQVLAKEVLRTDLYERSAGREYIYLKFRCARCKRMGQSFIPENKWDWSALEPEQNELTPAERDRFLDEAPISAVELLDFHTFLKNVSRPAELDDSLSIKSGDEAVSEVGLEAESNAASQAENHEEEGRERNERFKPPRFDANRPDRPDTGRLRGRSERNDAPRLPHPRANGDEENSSPT